MTLTRDQNAMLAEELAAAKARLAEVEEAGQALADDGPSLSKYWPEDLARWRALHPQPKEA